MATKMSITDAVRIAVLEALLKKGSVKPNIKQIKHYTGFHKATIISSLDFLEKAGLIQGYGPKINFRVLGYNLEVTTLFQADLSRKKAMDAFLEQVAKDPHMYWFSGMLGSGNWNLIARHIYRDVESYRKHTEEHYFEKVPGIYDLIRDRQIFFTTEPIYKSASRTKSIVEIIKRSKQGL
ncbi:MAG: Lrp/AsnC family transcriptional regulator [Candidatus Diapherotrites archaeon]|nr:Lrp/AsnC family transcriptional regulator [Candidatus Diapherotrites archaeon]